MKELLHVTSPLDHLPQVGTKVCFRSAELERREDLLLFLRPYRPQLSLSLFLR